MRILTTPSPKGRELTFPDRETVPFREPRFYAGVGSRKTPKDILALMTEIATTLAERQWTLRSGHAQGADMAFEQGGAHWHGQIFLPWREFGDPYRHRECTYFDEPESWTLPIAYSYHPLWGSLSRAAKLFHMRNVHQVLGPREDSSHSRFVLCWTPGARGTGGTGQAIRIAKGYGIPVYDLAGMSPAEIESFLERWK